MSRMPALFVSHGAPNLALSDTPARRFLEDWGRSLPRPEAILVVSAHWETAIPTVSAAARPATIHDFRGFEPALYELRYPAPGAPALAGRVAGLLADAGLPAETDPDRGLDHGAWVPLMLLFPAADLPVTQLAIQPDAGPAHHLRLGEALAPLRDAGVLILASGAATHNLAEFRGRAIDATPPDWVVAFGDWIDRAISEGRREDLLRYRDLAPFPAENHPSEEHLLPLFTALGAAADPRGRRVHASHTYGVIAMDAYVFE